jgi:hypothetical protein
LLRALLLQSLYTVRSERLLMEEIDYFHGETRRNDTHQSTTDPDAMLAHKGPGREAKLAYAGHVLLDNRHGLVANVCVTAATGTAEREGALLLLAEAAHAGTVAGDKGSMSPVSWRECAPWT